MPATRINSLVPYSPEALAARTLRQDVRLLRSEQHRYFQRYYAHPYASAYDNHRDHAGLYAVIPMEEEVVDTFYHYRLSFPVPTGEEVALNIALYGPHGHFMATLDATPFRRLDSVVIDLAVHVRHRIQLGYTPPYPH